MGMMINRRRTYLNYIKDVDYSTQYLTFVAIENGTFTFTPQNNNVISYSTDNGNTWTVGNTVQVNSGDRVMWKGTMTPNTNGIGSFTKTTNSFDVQGNVMSLLYGDNFKNQTNLSGKNNVFRSLLQSTKLVNAENLSLPATTLANFCYYYMFRDCTSLTIAPKLPATTLPSSCYRNMFIGCTKLSSIICLATNISGSNCTGSWVYGVAASGIFTKAASMSSWSTGVNGIPSGWTVKDYTE